MKNTIKALISFASLLLCTEALFAEDANINFAFPVPIPKDVTINAGEKVTWTGASLSHPLQEVTGATSDTALNGGFSASSSPFEFQFNTPGTYYYRCTNHGVFSLGGEMRGSITVQAAGQPTAVATATPDNTATPSGNCDSKPGLPLLLSPANGSSLTKANVSLDWEDTVCADSYIVVVKKDKKNGKIVNQKTVNKSAYKTPKLEKKFKYFWTVKACNLKGCKSSTPFSFSLK